MVALSFTKARSSHVDTTDVIPIRVLCRMQNSMPFEKQRKSWVTGELRECTMYVTLEPCPMCAGAIVQARIPRCVIGCMNPKAGCAGSVMNLLQTDGFNHQVDLTTGVLEEECSDMLKQFFRELRVRDAERKRQRAEELAEKIRFS